MGGGGGHLHFKVNSKEKHVMFYENPGEKPLGENLGKDPGALPYVGEYQVLNTTPFYDNLTLNSDPVFPSDHTQWPPFFPLSFQILHTNCNFSRASRAFWEIYKFCSTFYIKFAKFGLKLHFCTLNDPHFFFLSPHQKRSLFLLEHTYPFFQRNLTPNVPYRRSLVSICTSALSYSSDPPPPGKGYDNMMKKTSLNEYQQVVRNCAIFLQHKCMSSLGIWTFYTIAGPNFR